MIGLYSQNKEQTSDEYYLGRGALSEERLGLY